MARLERQLTRHCRLDRRRARDVMLLDAAKADGAEEYGHQPIHSRVAEDGDAAGPQDAPHLRRRLVELRDMFQHAEADEHVDAPLRERQPADIAPDQRRLHTLAASHRSHHRRLTVAVDADDGPAPRKLG